MHAQNGPPEAEIWETKKIRFVFFLSILIFRADSESGLDSPYRGQQMQKMPKMPPSLKLFLPLSLSLSLLLFLSLS